MSKTKAEIEAEIARLRARLEHLEIDSAFTPAELVRWDPSLLGATLHLQHHEDIPANAFDFVHAKGRQEHCLDSAHGSMSPGNVPSKKKMTMEGALTPVGVRYIKSARQIHSEKSYTFDVSNDFESMTKLPILVTRWSEQELNPTHTNFSCKALGMAVELNQGGYAMGFILPLANPDRPLLDQIFVATTARIHDTDVVVDKYPLSTLYNEWKRDKAAAPDIMTVGGARRPTVPPLRRTELDKAKEQIAELQAQMRLLLANRETDREAVLNADQAKATEISKQNERLREALHIAVQTTNATASTNTMDPM